MQAMIPPCGRVATMGSAEVHELPVSGDAAPPVLRVAAMAATEAISG